MTRAEEGAQAGLTLKYAGAYYSIELSESEGMHYAVRTLIELGVVEILGKLTAYRKEYGRDGDSFETIAPLVTPSNADDLKKIEDAGADGTVSYPFTYTVGPTSTLDEKRAYLEGYANNFIRT